MSIVMRKQKYRSVIYIFLLFGIFLGCSRKGTNVQNQGKQESPEMQVANSEFDKFMKSRFRKYGEKSSFIKFDLKDWNGTDYYKGTIIWEVTNLEWSVEEMRLDRADIDNGLDWVGKGKMKYSTGRRFIRFSANDENRTESGRTEYQEADVLQWPNVVLVKRKGQKLKIDDSSEPLQNFHWGGSHLRRGSLPSIEEIKDMQRLPFNKDLQIYSTFGRTPSGWLHPK